jgi:putative restriction endonuclease
MKGGREMTRRNWQRQELLLALNLYCKLPFGQYHGRNAEIMRLAVVIDRTPNAVAMKMSNFASLDPYHQKRGVAGLANIGQADREIWEEFHRDWAALAIESELAYREVTSDGAPVPANTEATTDDGDPVTEAERQVMVRIGQSFFRQVILTSYDQQCCICRLPVRDMLIASHIIPWRDATEHRLNPHNGLCLCALHDRGFDRGHVTVDAQYALIVGDELRRYLPNDAVETYFNAYHGRPIHLPDKFVPQQELLAVHREHYFKG